ncbi:MAG: phospho-sugar mutase [Clostridia bacterium]|nr:phospho-sugar mutase [Clostridia bacterium]
MNEMLQRWLSSPVVDDQTKQELIAVAENEKEIADRFGTILSFGTAGLRGVLGAGTNRMNIYVVRHATQGLAKLIRKAGAQACARGVVIGHDCRIMAREFAEEACRVLRANGIKAYLFDELRPTPEVSFAIRELNCIAGINITASHNPKEYNGYKVYWEDGAQLAPEQADVVYDSICSDDIFDDVKVSSVEEMKEKTVILGKDFDEKFLDCVLDCVIDPEAIRRQADMAIIFTPFHGTGYRLVPEALHRAGFKNVTCVPEQMVLSGEFPTVVSPNPENKEGFAIAMKLADEKNADFIIGTDPDADRVGVLVRGKDGQFVALTGNQTGALLLDYVLGARKNTQNLPANAAAVKSIVSTEMAAVICEKYGVKLFNVLTGFKFIGEKIKEFEATREHTYVFGFEESYGYLTGTYARDKDAVAAALLIAEMAAHYRERGMTLADALNALYEEFGVYFERTLSVTMRGFDGPARTQALMERLRTVRPDGFGGVGLAEVFDLNDGVMGLPKANVIYYRLQDGSVIIVRPSGTEPKVKIYVLVRDETRPAAEAKAELLRSDLYSFAGISEE